MSCALQPLAMVRSWCCSTKCECSAPRCCRELLSSDRLAASCSLTLTAAVALRAARYLRAWVWGRAPLGPLCGFFAFDSSLEVLFSVIPLVWLLPQTIHPARRRTLLILQRLSLTPESLPRMSECQRNSQMGADEPSPLTPRELGKQLSMDRRLVSIGETVAAHTVRASLWLVRVPVAVDSTVSDISVGSLSAKRSASEISAGSRFPERSFSALRKTAPNIGLTQTGSSVTLPEVEVVVPPSSPQRRVSGEL